jgi:sucrose phosphorylase
MGVPGLYIHSLLGSRNDLDGVKSTGRARSINREQSPLPALREELSAPGSRRQLVFDGLLRMLRIRAGEPAFHPDARQEIPRLHPAVFAVRRRPEQTPALLALHNVSDQSVDVALPPEEHGHDLFDLLAETLIPAAASISLAPHQVRWLKIR